MKTKTLLMVAGAVALVYWLWKKNKAKPEFDDYSTDDLGMPRVKSAFEHKMECIISGRTYVENHCIQAPCYGSCV